MHPEVGSRELLFNGESGVAQWLQRGALFDTIGLGIKDFYYTQDAPFVT